MKWIRVRTISSGKCAPERKDREYQGGLAAEVQAVLVASAVPAADSAGAALEAAADLEEGRAETETAGPAVNRAHSSEIAPNVIIRSGDRSS